MEKSSSAEDYMKSILILLKRNGIVRSVDVSEEMGVTRPSVCIAMKKLREQKIIYFDDNDHIYFTDYGKKIAEKIYGKHNVISRFLMTIGVGKDAAEKEACLMEHAISDETYECLCGFVRRLNNKKSGFGNEFALDINEQLK